MKIISKIILEIKKVTGKIKQILFMKLKNVSNERELYIFSTKKILIILAIFIVISFMLAMTFVSLWKEGEALVSVPNLIKKPLSDAILELQKKNLNIELKTIIAFKSPPGIVIDQDPKGGFYTKEKRSIRLFVSQRAKEGEVPNIIGKNTIEAIKYLKSKSSSVKMIIIGKIAYSFSDNSPAGKIISQDPAATTLAKYPLSINVLVSKGREGSVIVLPNLINQNLKNAITWLSMNDLTVKIENGYGRIGIVNSMTPRASAKITRGSLVILKTGGNDKYGVFNIILPQVIIISKSDLTKQNPKNNLKIDSNQYNIKVLLTQNGTQQEIYNGIKKSGDRIVNVFNYSDHAVLEMFIGGKKYITRRYN
ncbi:MAG: PASTA domain-containing protein [Spirochaetes bacterium]|nr:PASTA domain-containing protein [Spirochaetota bacterium]